MKHRNGSILKWKTWIDLFFIRCFISKPFDFTVYFKMLLTFGFPSKLSRKTLRFHFWTFKCFFEIQLILTICWKMEFVFLISLGAQHQRKKHDEEPNILKHRFLQSKKVFQIPSWQKVIFLRSKVTMNISLQSNWSQRYHKNLIFEFPNFVQLRLKH